MSDKGVVFGKRNKTLFFDALLVLVILAVALSVFLVFRLTRKGGAYARVTVGGEVVAEYSLSENGEYPLNGGTNVLVIKDGAAYMKEASCPDKTCITRHRTGISYDGETITCLPNRVRVEIFGGGER
ncbi:MAG: NusG domain II-containing protein [Clostridia bacterium]|nr:NusG domain II-containing protein [Clostridia bacterium]